MKTINMLRDRAWLFGLAFLLLSAASELRDAGSADLSIDDGAPFLSASHETGTQ